MTDKRGFEMAVSAVILIIIGFVVLIGLILLARKGFDFFDRGTEPIGTIGNVESIRQSCGVLCTAENKYSFCCTRFELNGNDVLCTNSTLSVDCNINCQDVVCE